ncbi:Calcium-dependent protein kinase 14 [Hibiscus syriacus]|uniref:non-specific serine/threonine protein kinase n=1 Tax=Hibiscus syriacus TaxID=106335 RepID=A0A6A3AFR5_HIBSY|nr:Calcium-dependent protein kinase 14 [Hibiscus syriacus]
MRKSKSTHLANNMVLKDVLEENILEKYDIEKELGRGEFGITYQCFDLKTGEAYACKKISKTKLKTEIDIEDVRREVEIMKHLPRHPNLVVFREAFEDNEAVYLIMELCRGGELFDRIVAKGNYTERAAKVIKTLLEIVKVCHDHGVIHRDLKPENFLLADESETAPIKVIDFGLSIFYEPGERFSDIVGSPYYMAPEVLRRNYGKEIDIWSTGVILYILLCGVPPFWADTEEGIAHAIIEGTIDFERDPWPKISDEAKDIVRSMLDPNPFTRRSVQELAPNFNLGENVGTRIKQFSLMSKFKKKVLRVVADNLPNEQIDLIIEMFNTMDTDDNGYLSFEELRDGLQKIGHSVSEHDVKMLMEAVGGHRRKWIIELTTVVIEFEELREALLQDDPGPNNEQLIKDIMQDVDKDKDGRISYQEFKAMMLTGMDWKMASRQYSRALINAVSIKMLKQSGQLK